MKTKITEKSILPFPTTSIDGGIKLCFDGGTALLTISYFSDQNIKKEYAIKFVKVRALREVAESHCSPWHLDAYNKISIVENSDWKKEISGSKPDNDYWVMNHFILFLDSCGAFEFLCEDFEILENQ